MAQSTPKKAYIKTYGCQMNEYDSAKMADILIATSDFVITNTTKDADLIVVNTCAIRDKAAQKVFSELGRLRFLKKEKPSLVLAVAGCLSQQERTNIFKQAPYVDIVLGPHTLHRLPLLYRQIGNKEKHKMELTAKATDKFDYFPISRETGSVAYLTIMEGCNKVCSYCVVPFTRGREISRNLEDIYQEALTLASFGTKEIHLLGQNVNAYYDPITKDSFATLLRTIAKIDTIQRIRFTTSHPAAFTEDLYKVYADIPKVVAHLHLPVQSGSDRILQLMRRGYTHKEYCSIIAKLRKVRPHISISTDFIVGFPGESDEDFACTLALVQEVGFDASFSFIYSPRPNTVAARMADELPLARKKERLLILQEQLATQARHYSKNMIGSVQKILVTERAKKNSQQFSGRTENNRVVNFAATENILGRFVDVKITDALPNSLRGELFGTYGNDR